jgi:hypothetical protein
LINDHSENTYQLSRLQYVSCLDYKADFKNENLRVNRICRSDSTARAEAVPLKQGGREAKSGIPPIAKLVFCMQTKMAAV